MTESNQLLPVTPASAVRVPARPEPLLPVQADRLDLTESVAFFRRRFTLILGVVVLCLLAGLAYALLAPKTYVANATVMLTNSAAENIRAADRPESREVLSSELVDTQAAIITSRTMAERVAGALGLGKGLDSNALRNVIDELEREVSAERNGNSYALAISYSATEAKAAATIANEFARQFAGWELRSTKENHAESLALVQQRLGELRAQAQVDTKALQQYRIANNLLSTSGASLTEQEISNYNQEVAGARAGAAEDEARLQTALAQLRSGSSGDDVGEALGSAVISSLRAQEAEAAGQVADLGSKYGAKHPQLIQAQSRLVEVRAQIQAEIGRVISNLRAKRDVSQQRLASLAGSLASARGMLTQNNSAMVGLSDLERAASASQSIYEAYLNRYKELLAAEGSERPNAKIITFADVPIWPEHPNIPLIMMLSLVIGLGVGVIAAYIAEAIFHGVSTPDELERVSGGNYLTSIPLLKSVEPKIRHAVTAMQHAPNSAFAESFRALDTAITQATHGQNQVIAITSALPDEGKTVIACCLSYVLAQNGKKTILIDCDLRRAGVSRLLDMREYDYGLIEYLDGTTEINLDDLSENRIFCVLPLRPSNEQPDHLLTGEAFVQLLDELRTRFDHIILDLPPVLPIAATPILASRADATVMTTRWRKTSRFALRAALKRMPADQVNLVGMALNQVDMRRRAYFERGDPSFYYKQYREYYS
ncbi:MAG: AAA family ATPase [Sphingomonadales bacterium]|jgi:succinoglycan biosynthesis transport protein ExoP|nr:AAA family ATPase [Sphingomonadales bacterium]MBK9002829.1 AAA family ATPase [Sphingomonadales bacterium]MBK9268054.1 AAA family ATPase [Sphingomonadales bacterium]